MVDYTYFVFLLVVYDQELPTFVGLYVECFEWCQNNSKYSDYVSFSDFSS